MKMLLYALGAVVGVILIAVVTLLAVGRSESTLTASIEVARPPAVVFAWVSEPERVKRWLGWLKEIRPVSPVQDQPGARQIWVMEDRNNNNQLMEIDTEFLIYKEPTSLTARVSSVEGFTGTVEYALEALGPDRTRLRYTGSYQFHHWLAKLLEPVITRSAQQKLEDDLARLKEQAEAESVAIR
jgi:carbon monoxide dehydrogenase subunit G